MKLLPKQEINKAKAQERKQDIDNGLVLAKKVDALRESRVKEEESLRQWRESSISKIQREIDSYLEVKENLRIETEKAELHRKKLIAPLDDEWVKVNVAKSELHSEKSSFAADKEELKSKSKKLDIELSKVSETHERITWKEIETDKALNEILTLKREVEDERDIAKKESDEQIAVYEQRMLDATRLETEYEVGIKTNELKAKILEEKEEELIIREKELERQQKNLRITAEAMKSNDRMSTDN